MTPSNNTMKISAITTKGSFERLHKKWSWVLNFSYSLRIV